MFSQPRSTEVNHHPQPDPRSIDTAPPLLPPFTQGRDPPGVWREGPEWRGTVWADEIVRGGVLCRLHTSIGTSGGRSVKGRGAVYGIKPDWYLRFTCC